MARPTLDWRRMLAETRLSPAAGAGHRRGRYAANAPAVGGADRRCANWRRSMAPPSKPTCWPDSTSSTASSPARWACALQSLSTTVMTPRPSPSPPPIPRSCCTQLKDYRFGTPTQQAAGTLAPDDRTQPRRTHHRHRLHRGGLCNNRFSASLSEARSGVSFDALMAAHEIGHVFGAPHDGETAPRPATPRARPALMAPQLNGSRLSRSCSLDQIAPVVATRRAWRRWMPRTALDAPSRQVAAGAGDSVAAVRCARWAMPTVHGLGTADVAGAIEHHPALALTLGGSDRQGDGIQLRCSLGTCAPGTRPQRDLRCWQRGRHASPTLRVTAANDAAWQTTRARCACDSRRARTWRRARRSTPPPHRGRHRECHRRAAQSRTGQCGCARLVITLPANLALQSQTLEACTARR